MKLDIAKARSIPVHAVADSAARFTVGAEATSSAEVLRNSIRTTRHHDAKLVSVGIAQHYPTDPTFAGSSHEVSAELESSFGDLIRIVRVEVNVAATEGEIINVAALKRHIRTSTRRVTQSYEFAKERSWLVPRECGPKLAEAFGV
jgi:hypothetical protein